MVLLDEESDGEDSAVSLSDLAATELADGEVTSPPPSPAEPFEFLSAAVGGGGGAMCAANDVISGGKLLPFRDPGRLPAKTDRTHIAGSLPESDHRRSSSMGDRPAVCFWDTSSASGYRRLRRVADPDPARARPKWYLMAFGSVRVPAGMEMSEIRIRQRRRNSPPPPAPAAEECGSWKLLRSLSCKGVEVAGGPERA